MEEQRKRGGQKGNHNAMKHGYYSQAFKKADRVDFDLAAGLEGFNEEIALLRFEIKKAISGGDTKNLMPLTKAAAALEKLIRTDFKINGGNQYASLRKAQKRLMRELILPDNPSLAIDAIKRWCGYNMNAEKTVKPITNDGENKADLP